MDFILGVDGGGTKTVVQISDLSGEVVTENSFFKLLISIFLADVCTGSNISTPISIKSGI
ncbi:unnamed protein product, partial [marine sediment metagenome]